MNNNLMSQYRSEIIDKFVNLEIFVNTIITKHYLGQIHTNFIFEVLYDEQFSFGLKRKILLKARSNLNNSKFIENIGRINTIRNLFAHCGMEYFEIKTKETIIPDPKNYKKTLDPKALYDEFIEKEKYVADELVQEMNKMGIKMYKDIEEIGK